MAFVAEDFVQDVSWEVFDELKKPDLMALAVYLEIEVKHAMRKQVIKNTLIDRLVADDLLDEECLENKVEILDSSDSALKLKQLEIQKEVEMTKLKIEEQERKEKLDLEKILKQQELDARLQMEEKERQDRLEMEERIKLKEIEAKVQMEKDKLEKQGLSTSQTNLMPQRILVFIGKAREIYSSLSIEQCHNYDVVKKAVLKAYELVPEAYRQKFRSAKKETNQTHVEFARVQEQMLDRWLSSKNVNNEYKQLRQLVLVEQFKSCIHADIRTHLDERDINNLEDAATMADDYALTHKLSTNNTGGHNKFSQYHKNNYNKPNQNKSSQNQNSTKEGNKQSGPSNQGSKGPSSEKPTKSWDGFKKSVTCDYCKEPGHTKSKCWKLMGKQLALQQQSAPTGCAVAMRSQVSFQAVKQKDVESEKIREDFEPFVLEGSVSLESDKVDPKPIKIMRDTCCAQSMILEGSLPFSEVSATGTVIVGVRPELPVKGVSMLLGNDLAGGKVLPQPIVTREPCTEAGNDDESSVVFPACAVTRSMTQKAMLEANSKDKGDDLVPNLDLEGTFMTELDEPGIFSLQGRKVLQNIAKTSSPCLMGQ
ncbi:hypothetical protein BSL78_02290 [Apostichopus japonicus]|uniref:SCAN box domain-containing protein n=1 Tax=Stichopus japonicus TaxID=307972 RepID=A0A2G8LKM4_STIJA|nr:hypothetical protein BSL78_02290 [Apostichopus japonicus]